MLKENDADKKEVAVEESETKKSLKKFLKWLIIIVFALFVVVYSYANSLLRDGRDLTNKDAPDTGLKERSILKDIFVPAKKQINFVLLGVDEDRTRTDLIMIGTFKTKEKTIDIISVPRDIYVEYTQEEKDFILNEGRLLPINGYLKLNEVHHYPSPEYGVDFITAKLEDIFDIKFDYYAKIDIEGFKYMVDGVGGVEFDVPQRMYYIDDYNGYTIDLQPGLQVLDGSAAEQLIRYRQASKGYEKESPNYAMPDIQRNEVQREFLKSFISQLIQKENIISNSQVIISTLDQYVTTNFNLNEVPKYLKYVNDIDMNNIRTNSIPAVPKNVNGNTISYLEIVEEGSKKIIDEVFYNKKQPIEPIPSKGLSIQILNSTDTSGLAMLQKEFLDSEGINIENVDDYLKKPLDKTIIYVKKEGMGKDLLEYYKKAEIIHMPEQDYYDIVIVLGMDMENIE